MDFSLKFKRIQQIITDREYLTIFPGNSGKFSKLLPIGNILYFFILLKTLEFPPKIHHTYTT